MGGISGILVVYRQHAHAQQKERESEPTVARCGHLFILRWCEFFVVIRRRPHEHEDTLMMRTPPPSSALQGRIV